MPKSPVVASYIADFLKRDQFHVFRQITGLREVTPHVFTHHRENEVAFPLPARSLTVLPKPRTRWLRRFIHRQILGEPWQMYDWELRDWLLHLNRVEARVLHVYFGHIAPQFIPLMKAWPHPVVVSFHGADAGVDMAKPKHLRCLREVFRLADRILCRSESLAQDVRALGCAPEKVAIQRTGIPLESWPFHLRPEPVDGAWHLVQSCRFIAKKGLDATVAAFAEVLKTFPKARLTLIGEGPERGNLTRQIDALGIGSQVQFTGFISEDAVRAHMNEAHVFVHPSCTSADGNREGVPNSMLEAMASGLPVVATRHGGIPEAVTEGEAGYLVAEKDAKGLAAAVLMILKDQDLRHRLSEGARRSVETGFDRSSQIRHLEACYKDLMLTKSATW
jgi:colanic acid/amylovoran biosynthesis glycosyltransferase